MLTRRAFGYGTAAATALAAPIKALSQTTAPALDADNPGPWALHCHMLYHMEAGMFTRLRYV